MASSKCPQCGLVNPLSAPTCKRCGTELAIPSSTDETAVAPSTENQEEGGKEKESEPLGAWGCTQLVILFVIASVVTGYLGIYIREYLPSGPYPVILLIAIFLPAAVVGLLIGGLVVYILNIPVKLLSKKPPSDQA
ncbi:MAG TPA: zinc ribbon domain-containing protein [Pyrinomonadaceae bacterium]|jgi:hypothetical protein|nr:zinc ribbon domain-containing protein [Pyrinomonadaceae bacterium]